MSSEGEHNGRSSPAGKQHLQALRVVRIQGTPNTVRASWFVNHSSPHLSVTNYDELIERSSFGTEDAQRARRSTSDAKVAEIVARVRGIGRVDGHISSAEPSRRWRTEQMTMAGKKNGETTSSKVASQASKILSNPKSSAAAKSVAASALTQAANKGKKSR